MKNLANTLTISRIILASILLIFFKKISVLFLIIYAIAQFTDMIDGTIARKTGSASPKGAFLDSIADLLLASNLIKIVFKMKIIKKRIAVWLFIALGIGALSPIINYINHKCIFFIHSIASKICGGAISLIPFAIYFGFSNTYIVFCLILITLAMIELCFMSILLDIPDPDAKSLRSMIKGENYILI